MRLRAYWNLSPSLFGPDDLIATPERHSHAVWEQRPAHGVVADIDGWTVLLTRGTYRPTEISGRCERLHGPGVVDLALGILGFSWDDDEDALDGLLGWSPVKGVLERATEGVERIRRFQAAHEDHLRCWYVEYDAAFFVTRIKKGMRFRRRASRPVDFATGVVSDHTIGVVTAEARRRYPAPLRRVRYVDPQTKKRFGLLTEPSPRPRPRDFDAVQRGDASRRSRRYPRTLASQPTERREAT